MGDDGWLLSQQNNQQFVCDVYLVAYLSLFRLSLGLHQQRPGKTTRSKVNTKMLELDQLTLTSLMNSLADYWAY